MNRIRNLDSYQKGILILLAVLMVVFAVVYHMVISRVGFAYENAILVPSTENGNTVYSGTIKGQKACFTVTPDKTVTFRYGDTVYGPYTAKEDPTAIPEENGMSQYMTGVEIREGEKILFRGGILVSNGAYWTAVSEDGNNSQFLNVQIESNGVRLDADGNVIDPMEPSLMSILQLMKGPELVHKGHWGFWFIGIFFSVVMTVPLLFADELFYWRMSYRVRNADQLEPSDHEIASRYISWTLTPIGAIIFYIMGLRV